MNAISFWRKDSILLHDEIFTFDMNFSLSKSAWEIPTWNNISEYIDLENINFRYLIFLSKRIAPTQFIPVFATTLLIQNANISVFSSVRIFPQMLSVYLIILYKQYGC